MYPIFWVKGENKTFMSISGRKMYHHRHTYWMKKKEEKV